MKAQSPFLHQFTHSVRKILHHLGRVEKHLLSMDKGRLIIGIVILLIVASIYSFRLGQQKLNTAWKATITPTMMPETPTPIPPDSIHLPIIMYHYVEYVKETNDLVKNKLNINPALFEQQLKSFQQEGYTTYFAKEIPDILNGKIQLKGRSVILTFDDGYEDFYSVVVPLLTKYQMKGTDYVINDYIGRKGFLTKKQLQEMVKNPYVEIGSHTLDHVYLKTVPDTLAIKQITESKKGLEDLLGVPVVTFAYPYGAVGVDTPTLVKQASFSAAMGTNFGQIHSKETIFNLTRIRAGYLVPGRIAQILDKIQK